MRMIRWILPLALLTILALGCDKRGEDAKTQAQEGGEPQVVAEKDTVEAAGKEDQMQAPDGKVVVQGKSGDFKVDVEDLVKLRPRSTEGSGSCAEDRACIFRCPDGGCKVECAPRSNCSMMCAGGGCEHICEGGCSATCSGGGCKQVCKGGSCKFTCSGGGCEQIDDGAEAFAATCSGGNCS